MSTPISIVIRTFNSSRTLGEVITRLDLQPADEIIVVDSGSKDDTLSIAKKHNASIVIAEPPFNYSKSLNAGFQAAKNPWVLVISSHCVPVSDNLLATFRAAILTFPGAVAVAYGDCSLIEFLQTNTSTVLLADQTATDVKRKQVYGGNGLALYRRNRWQMQPFDESLPTAEDLAWFQCALKYGAMAARVPRAQVLYRNQGSLRHMFNKGWLESQMAIALTGGRGTNFLELGINWGSLLKKWSTAKIPLSTLLRQGAHALGAYLGPKCSSWQKKRATT